MIDAILNVKKNLHCGYEIEKLLHHALRQIEKVFGESELVYIIVNKKMTSIKDDRGFNQGFEETPSTIIRFERRAEEIISEIDNAAAKQILEIGCGTGGIAYYIAQKTGMNVLGTDLCRPFIEEAKTKYQLPNLRFEVLDFNDPVGVAARKFDYIVGNGVLHHLYYNLDIALKTIFNLLNQQGEMIFWEPNIYNPYCALIFNIPYFRTLAHLEPTEMGFSEKIHRR